ncbi:hypothetical protein [Aestuariivivens sediminicola]|uniref:hypothetical protein n=1 Tax=Aestuariivivens sediminicola TaxID=2913560 RepID=UPI001F56A928|nr:hypothetical protein [Aestuariivivens sediminicola]
MKNIFVFSLILSLLVSCSIGDDSVNYDLEILPVESVDIPDEFEFGQTYPITVYYYRPTTCHAFRNFYYERDDNVRTVAPITYVDTKNNCSDLTDNLVEATFNFIVTRNGSYIFKFWQGEDSSGEDLFLSIEVPVL